MNYFKLAYTTPDVLEKIKEAEKNGDFNAHIDPIDYSNCQPVDENFPYIPAGMTKLRQALIRAFIISPFMWIVNRFIFRTKIYKDYGNEKNKPDKYTIIKNNNVIRQSYKNINGNITVQSYVNGSMIKDTSKSKTEKGCIQSSPGMVITCNHINKLDALVVRWALKKSGMLRGRQLKVMVADFNNQKGRLGRYMRAFGILPFSSEHRMIKLFDSAVSHYLNRGDCILVYPEQSEWWGYDRPRPLKRGAFYYAVKNNVPVQPIFVTCRDGKGTVSGVRRKYFDVHILERIVPVCNTAKDHEKVQHMMEENSREWQDVYNFNKNKIL